MEDQIVKLQDSIFEVSSLFQEIEVACNRVKDIAGKLINSDVELSKRAIYQDIKTMFGANKNIIHTLKEETDILYLNFLRSLL